MRMKGRIRDAGDDTPARQLHAITPERACRDEGISAAHINRRM